MLARALACLGWPLRWLRSRSRSGTRLPGRPRPKSENGSEHRREIRFNINLETSCLLIAALDGDPTPIKVRNISAGGISLVLNRGVEPDTVLTIQLLNRPRMFFCKVEVRVTYIVEHPSGDWILGGSFARKLSDEELRCLLAKD